MLSRVRDNTLTNHPTTCSPYRLLFLRIVSSSNSSQCHFPKLPSSLQFQPPGPNFPDPFNLARVPGECSPRSTFSACFSLSGTGALRSTGEPRPPVPLSWSPPLFMFVSINTTRQSVSCSGKPSLLSAACGLVETLGVQANGGR